MCIYIYTSSKSQCPAFPRDSSGIRCAALFQKGPTGPTAWKQQSEAEDNFPLALCPEHA